MDPGDSVNKTAEDSLSLLAITLLTELSGLHQDSSAACYVKTLSGQPYLIVSALFLHHVLKFRIQNYL
jgi:hypothetical protein